MKSLVTFPLFFLLISCSQEENNTKPQFFANVAQSVITPPKGTFMIEPRANISTGTHDDLFEKAIALGDGIDTFVIVSFDLIGFTDLLVNSIHKAVFDSAGIKAEQLMLNCSHTHNSPVTMPAMFPLPEDEDLKGKSACDKQWENKMVTITAGTVKSAVNNLRKVSMSQGKAPVQIGFNRRLNNSVNANMTPNSHGPVLRETDVVVIEDNESEIALLFSYAAHPVCVHYTSYEFSADFPGYAVQYINSKYPGSMPAFLQGCGGNVNSTLVGGYEVAELDGFKLGEAVVNGAESSEPIDPSRISYGQRNFYLPFMDIDIETAKLVIKRIEESSGTNKENPDFKRIVCHMVMDRWAQKFKSIAEDKDAYPGLPFQAQAIAFGKSLAIIAYPDEVFVDYAIYIKEHSPFEQTIVLGYTNGCKSYIPSAEAFYLGGYETTTAQMVYGQPYLTPACDKIIKTESIELLNELWESYADS